MEEKQSNETEISWQNKDITSKMMAAEFKGKTFSVYGLSLPDIVEVKPTNMPDIEANELRLDNLFYLADGSVAIVDYESEYRESNKLKYLSYIARVIKRIYNDYKEFKRLRIIVIYTADVVRGSTDPCLDLGGAQLILEEAFLSDFDPEKLWEELADCINNMDWSDEVLMKLVIYPLTLKGNEAKKKAVAKAVDLAEKIEDKERQVFALTGIYVFSDKLIQREDAERIRRLLNMTQVEQIYTEERMEAVRVAVEENEKKNLREKEEAVIRLLKAGNTAETVAFCMNMLLEDVKKLEKR